jgi:serine/threonine protein kinase
MACDTPTYILDSYEPFEKLSKIGEGGAANIFKVLSPFDHQIYALKVSKPNISCDREIDVYMGLSALDVDTTPRLHAYGMDKTWLAMEIIDAPLFREIKKVDVQVYKNMIIGTIRAVQNVNRAGFIHMDLHFGNLFYNPTTSHVSLIDFTSAKKLFESNPFYGWKWVMPPETRANNTVYSVKGDVWGVGIAVYSLWTGFKRHGGISGINDAIGFNAVKMGADKEAADKEFFDSNKFVYSAYFPQALKELVQDMVNTDPEQRPTLEEALERFESLKL